MATELGLAPPAKRPLAAAPTTITGIGDDLLREIFLLLPSLPSLVRAALACRTFLGAVRSCPAFRRRFLALHPPQLLGFFICPSRIASHPFVPSRGRSDPDLAAAVRGADFFLTRLPEDGGSSLAWQFETCYGGYAVLLNYSTDQIAAYNPLTQALHLFPQPTTDKILSPHGLPEYFFLSEEDQGVLRMVCVQHRNTAWQVPARVAVFSPATSSEWQIMPWVETGPPLQPEDDGERVITFYPGTQVKGFVYWKHTSQAYVLVLNTATLQFSRVDLPAFFEEIENVQFMLGQTKDGELCMAATDDNDGKTGMLVVCVWRADDGGVEKWMEHTFALSVFVDATEDDSTMQVEAIIDGYVYLSTKYSGHAESLLSLCLETAMLTKLFDGTYTSPSHPYIMVWPSSLVYNKASPCLKIPVSRKMVTSKIFWKWRRRSRIQLSGPMKLLVRPRLVAYCASLKKMRVKVSKRS